MALFPHNKSTMADKGKPPLPGRSTPLKVGGDAFR